MRLTDIGEAGLIARLQKRLGLCAEHRRNRVVMGIGDDAAILEALAPHAVASADMLVEGVDFEWAWATGRDVGHKAAAVNLSDLAAMGAKPRGLLASVALDPNMHVAMVLDLLAMLHRVGKRFGAPLVGGDISRIQGPCVIAVTALGQIDAAHALRRHQAQPRDIIAVTGTLGAASAGLWLLQHAYAPKPSLMRRQLRPMPQVAVGRALARSGLVRAAADISDGLIKDVVHLLKPGAGAVLDPKALPIARGVRQVAQLSGQTDWQMALSGGEDFELVLAIGPTDWPRAQATARRHKVVLTAVGRVQSAPGIHLAGMGIEARQVPSGFDHFASG